jgi:UDP-2,3-diacylglucosamine hydrolase
LETNHLNTKDIQKNKNNSHSNVQAIDLPEGKNIYFASDFHLGVPTHEESRKRENRIVSWLDSIKGDAFKIYLVGDIFDFWFEYKRAIPKGFTRFLGKIAELTDSGIEIEFFTGNHDMWMFDYLEKELGVKIHKQEIELLVNSTSIFIAHGDGLGPGDYSYKFIKKVFSSKVCQWLFARLHPNFGIGLANFFSKSSRKHSINDNKFLGEDKEWLITFCKEKLKQKHVDYFIFGHRHHPIEVKLNDSSTYINLGEWISHNTYSKFNGKTILINTFTVS